MFNYILCALAHLENILDVHENVTAADDYFIEQVKLAHEHLTVLHNLRTREIAQQAQLN